jgi:CrcB protein
MAPARTNAAFVDGRSRLPSAFAINTANPLSRHAMQSLNNYLLVFVGGGAGACLRHACNLIGARVAMGSPWPWSTFLINLSGALLMGVVVEAFALRNGASPQLRLLLATGILGGYTTFSTYALEIGVLLQRGQHGLAALYAGGSVALGVAGLFGGMKLARLALG